MAELTILREDDADLSALAGRKVAIIGFGAQGRAQALCMRESGVEIIIGVRRGASFDAAVGDGFPTMSVAEASRAADIIHILLPDEIHGDVFRSDIAPAMRPGTTLSFSHSFSVVFKELVPPADSDVILVAPKGIATAVRERYLAGSGVAGLIAVEQDRSGHARQDALALAKAMGYTRSGVLECTMKAEACGDIFGEQNVLCGGMVDLMKYGFEVLTEAGYPPEVAYFECIHEVKLIVDLVYAKGLAKMNEVISNTAEWGEYVNGPRIISPDVKERMKQSLRDIESGKFAASLLAEVRSGAKNLAAKREELRRHPAEAAGARVRALFNIK